MEREKGFESVVSRAVSDTYAAPESAPEGSTQPHDASVHVRTGLHASDTLEQALPSPTPDLFIDAGIIVADRASRAHATASTVEDILRRAVRHAAVLLAGDA
jgi:hypothetical protein